MPGTGPGGPSPAVLHEILSEARQTGFLGPGPIETHLRHATGFSDLARLQPLPPAGNPRLLDLGSGGGLPGLVMAGRWPEARLVLLDANERRTTFLRRAVARCGLEDRVTVVHQRAEDCGRDPAYRGSFDGVVVRSFGAPAVVAECAAPFLRVGGWVIVSEPPGSPGAGEAGGAAQGAEASQGGEIGQEGEAGQPDQRSERGERPEPGEARQPREARQATDSKELGDSPDATASGTRWPAAPLAQFGLEPVSSVRGEFGYQVLVQREACPERFPRRNGVPAKHPLF